VSCFSRTPVLWLLSLGVALSVAAQSDVPPTECDRLAAHPLDPDRVVEGVAFADIDGERAIASCRTALSQYPDSTRILFQLGRAYDAKGDAAAAEKYYRRAAELGSAAAEVTLASFLWNGEATDLPADDQQPELLRLLEEASAAGHPEAQRALGVMLLANATPGDDERGMQLLTSAADADYPRAQYDLGYRYLTVKRTQRDTAKGIAWLTKAADNGEPRALAMLGTLHEEGLLVAKDYPRAAALYRFAADQGSAYAQYRLGRLYYLGRGVARSDKEAVAWLSRAAMAGQSESYNLLARINFDKYQNAKEAFRWWTAAVNVGDEAAAENLLLAYAVAFSIPDHYGLTGDLHKQTEDAMELMRGLAGQGNTPAQITLALFYRDGLGEVEKNPERARYWFQQAADAGDDAARKALAEMDN
jgi:TPR repeat protein